MVAYVGVAPVAGGFASAGEPRRAFLVALDLARAGDGAAACPSSPRSGRSIVLIFLLQSASAGVHADLPGDDPGRAARRGATTPGRCRSRGWPTTWRSLVSPALAALLLAVIGFHWLFGGTFLGFLLSAALVLSITVPSPAGEDGNRGFIARVTHGMRIYLATPRLRGLLALNLSVAAAGAMVFVNTVVIVKTVFDGADADVALALAFFGGGSMLAAILLPRTLERVADRLVMLAGAAALGALLAGYAQVSGGSTFTDWAILLAVWAALGLGYSAILVPTGRLLRRSAHPEDRPAVFAAQFSLSHACWLLTYPLAGRLGPAAGMDWTLIVLAGLTFAGAALAAFLWPSHDPVALPHRHPDLPRAHPHLTANRRDGRHVHPYVIDELHPTWPSPRN
jgi:hypothetical protein